MVAKIGADEQLRINLDRLWKVIQRVFDALLKLVKILRNFVRLLGPKLFHILLD